MDKFTNNPLKHLLRIIQIFLDIGTLPLESSITLRNNLIINHNDIIKTTADIESWLIQHHNDTYIERSTYYQYIHIIFKSDNLKTIFILPFPNYSSTIPSK